MSDEFAGADLGDVRRHRRLIRVAEQIQARAGESLPSIFSDPSQLEGAYRLFNNEDVDAEELMNAHVRCVRSRALAETEVLVLHDTTGISFGGEAREGLGPVGGGPRLGFHLHTSFCVGRDGRPLGVGRIFAWHRVRESRGHRPQQESQYDPDRESLRWNEAVHECADVLHDCSNVVHVMDREGDCMELLADMREQACRFVVRVAHDRRLTPHRRGPAGPKLYERLATAPLLAQRQVHLVRATAKAAGPKVPGNKRRASVEWAEQRLATLEIRAATLDVSPGNGAHAHVPDVMVLNYVDVCEIDPPEGIEPVHWRLVTTEPIATPDEVLRVVDIYRRRWMIEELFKALKTGCGYELLQLESGDALIRALPIYLVAAWNLLRVRWVSREYPDEPASSYFSESEVEAVRAMGRPTKPLPTEPTMRDVFLEIARIGGHLPQNGDPGWLVLRRGMNKIRQVQIGLRYRTKPTTRGDVIIP